MVSWGAEARHCRRDEVVAKICFGLRPAAFMTRRGVWNRAACACRSEFSGQNRPIMNTFYLATDVGTWWDSLDGAYRFFLTIGIIAGVVSLLLTFLAVLGFGHDAPELHTEYGDSAGDSEAFSIRTVTGFCLAFGWAGAGALSAGQPMWVASLAAVGAGLVVMACVRMLLKSMKRLRSDGTMKIENAVGAEGQAYITIPPAGETGGQVIVNFNNRQETLPAVQTGDTPIPGGARIKVTAVSGRMLTVTRH